MMMNELSFMIQLDFFLSPDLIVAGSTGLLKQRMVT